MKQKNHFQKLFSRRTLRKSDFKALPRRTEAGMPYHAIHLGSKVYVSAAPRREQLARVRRARRRHLIVGCAGPGIRHLRLKVRKGLACLIAYLLAPCAALAPLAPAPLAPAPRRALAPRPARRPAASRRSVAVAIANTWGGDPFPGESAFPAPAYREDGDEEPAAPFVENPFHDKPGFGGDDALRCICQNPDEVLYPDGHE